MTRSLACALVALISACEPLPCDDVVCGQNERCVDETGVCELIGDVDEEYRGEAIDCGGLPVLEVLVILRRRLDEPTTALVGVADARAVNTWTVSDADDVTEDGERLTLSGAFRFGTDASAWLVDVERDGSGYAGLVEVALGPGGAEECSDLQLERTR